MVSDNLVLSLFPGLGLLDRAFEQEGFTIVRGPDLLWGGDIHRFHAPPGVFAGVIGGPSCKAFSFAAAIGRSKGHQPVHPNLIPEFERVVFEAQPTWFVMENVCPAPTPSVSGYQVKAIVLNNRWLGEEQSRKRRFSFGTRDGRKLVVEVALFEHPNFEYAVIGKVGGHLLKVGGVPKSAAIVKRRIAAYARPFSRLCELQGLPPDFLDHAPFTAKGKREVLGNGVAIPMGRAVARAVKLAFPENSS